MAPRPERLDASPREKIWGSRTLSPWFPDSEKEIGEVWFTRTQALPVLVKFLFTTQKLSVQVHPGGGSGKTEMWHILRADSGAAIALGPREPVSAEQLRKASETGEIVDLLRWFPVAPGETYFIPAGTVHAIGEGISLCEIQQNSDVTYRLYDYGRDRELHLEEALAVAHLEPHPGKTGANVACDYFATELLELDGPSCHQPREWELLAILEGEGTYGEDRFRAGEVWYVPAGAASAWIRPDSRARLFRIWVPESPKPKET
jgi:mannose-6-phosphate isomerase